MRNPDEKPIRVRDRKGVQRNGGLPSPRGRDAFSLPDRDAAPGLWKAALVLGSRWTQASTVTWLCRKWFHLFEAQMCDRGKASGPADPAGTQDHSRESCTRWERAQVQGDCSLPAAQRLPPAVGAWASNLCFPLRVPRSKGTAWVTTFPPGRVYSTFLPALVLRGLSPTHPPRGKALAIGADGRSQPAAVPSPPTVTHPPAGARRATQTPAQSGGLPRRSRGQWHALGQ